MFGTVGKAHKSRKILVLVQKRLKQNSKPEYLLALALFESFQVIQDIIQNTQNYLFLIKSSHNGR